MLKSLETGRQPSNIYLRSHSKAQLTFFPRIWRPKTHTHTQDYQTSWMIFGVSTPQLFPSLNIKVVHPPVLLQAGESWAMSSQAQPFKTPSFSAFFFSFLAAFASNVVESFTWLQEDQGEIFQPPPQKTWNNVRCVPFWTFGPSPPDQSETKTPTQNVQLQGTMKSMRVAGCPGVPLGQSNPRLEKNIAAVHSGTIIYNHTSACSEGVVLSNWVTQMMQLHLDDVCMYKLYNFAYLLQTSWYPHSFRKFLKSPVHVFMSIPYQFDLGVIQIPCIYGDKVQTLPKPRFIQHKTYVYNYVYSI